MKLKPIGTISKGKRRHNYVLPQPENIELVFLRHPDEYSAFYLVWKNVHGSMSNREIYWLKEVQPWFAPTGEIFNFVLSYLFKNGPISDWLVHKWGTWKPGMKVKRCHVPCPSWCYGPCTHSCPKTREFSLSLYEAVFHIEKANEI